MIRGIERKNMKRVKAEARSLLGYSMLEVAGRVGISQPGVVYAVRRGERIAREGNVKPRLVSIQKWLFFR